MLTVNEEKEDPMFIEVCLNGVFWRRLHKRLFLHRLKRLAASTDEKALREEFEVMEEKIAKQEAVKLLSKKSYFTHALKEKLREKAFSPSAILKAVSYCEKIGAIDEGRKVEYLIAKERARGKGPHFIRAKLKSLSIDPSLIDRHLKQDEAEDIARIKQLLKSKKFSAKEEKKKAVHFLQRRGFSLESIFSALRES